MRPRAFLMAAFVAAATPDVAVSEVNIASMLTPPGGPMAGTNGGYIRQLLPDPFRGGYYACGLFGGLQSVLASGIAHVGSDGSTVTALKGSAAAGAAGTISGTCTAEALDPMDSDSVYVGISPSGTCGTAALTASTAGLCKWSWAAQTWTLLATVSGTVRASIRSIAVVSSGAGSLLQPTVYFGGDFATGCASPRGTTIPSPSLCKIVGGVVTGLLNRDTGVAGVAPLSLNGATTVRAILPAGPAVPSWLASTGADVSSAAFVCGELACLVLNTSSLLPTTRAMRATRCSSRSCAPAPSRPSMPSTTRAGLPFPFLLLLAAGQRLGQWRGRCSQVSSRPRMAAQRLRASWLPSTAAA